MTNSRPEEHDEDEDSLFGSPPPSPRSSGRPASPALALPSSGCSGSRPSTSTAPATQNVGTIALPGSHPDSELPMNPLALSLNHGIVHRPPAQHQVAAQASRTCPTSLADAPGASSHLWTATSGAGPSTAPRKPKKRGRQPSRSDVLPAPKPRGPEFALPDPSAPPPVHFLRNQENLLGKAGLVAGVKPAALTHSRGSTPSNPILVDAEDAPMLGRRTRLREQSQPYIDSSLLTAPTNQEIVSVLIGQKDIFPILEGVLKLVMGSTPATAPPRLTGFERRPSVQSNITNNTSSEAIPPPPVKKRKLNRVPAGASDWDVPYPFPQGEGPDSYRSTWERERGKQLISQLIKLIKSAARKAATKKYLQQEKFRQQEQEDVLARRLTGTVDPLDRVNRYYRPETASASYGTDNPARPAHDVQDASNSPIMQSSDPTQTLSPISPTATSSPQQPAGETTTSNAFDQLMTSLDGALPNEQPTSLNPLVISMDAQRQEISNDAGHSALSPPAVDQPLFDTWMALLDNFPVSFDGISNHSSRQSGEPSSSHCSTPGLDDFNELANMPANEFDAMLSSMLSGAHTGPGGSSNQATPTIPMSIDTAAANSFGDHLIDPSLLGLCADPGISPPALMNMDAMQNQNHALLDRSASQAPSPIGSTSSSGNNGPSTPVSAGWDLSTPDLFVGVPESEMDGQGWEGGNAISGDSLPDFGLLPEMLDNEMNIHAASAGKDKGKQKAVEILFSPTPAPLVSLPIPSPLPLLPLPQQQTVLEALLGVQPLLPSFVPLPRARQLRKDDILKRAQEKRKRLQEELDTVKKQLWETTIEQAGLVHLARKLDEAEAGIRSAS